MAGRTRHDENDVNAIAREAIHGLIEAVKQAMNEVRRSWRDAESARVGHRVDGRGQRRMDCLSPGCGARSKGPRFRYLCETHLDASQRDVDRWRELRKKA